MTDERQMTIVVIRSSDRELGKAYQTANGDWRGIRHDGQHICTPSKAEAVAFVRSDVKAVAGEEQEQS